VAAAILISSFSATVRSGLSFAGSEVQLAGTEALLDAGLEIAATRLLDAKEGQPWLPDSSRHAIPFAGARLVISVSDANCLIDINKADKELLLGFFRHFTGSEQQAARFRDRILEARGSNEKRKQGPQRSANADGEEQKEPPTSLPFLDVAQLRGLAGMTPELYKRIAPFLTVYSRDGRINPLAAPDEVLLSIPQVREADIAKMRSILKAGREKDEAIADIKSHASAYLADEPGPAYLVSVLVHRRGASYAAGRVYVVAPHLDTNAPYRLIAKRPVSSVRIAGRREFWRG
jgi:general secretion pathway protein K